jgi:hypothetical protein
VLCQLTSRSDETFVFINVQMKMKPGFSLVRYKARRGGAERSNTRELTIHDAARMFWGVLRTHTLLEAFIYHDFQGHPKLASYSIEHLFRNRLSPGVVEGLRTKGVGMKKDLDPTTSLANKLKTKVGL